MDARHIMISLVWLLAFASASSDEHAAHQQDQAVP